MVVGLGEGDVVLVGPCAGFDECFDLGAQDEQELPVRGSLDVLAAMQFREVLFAPQPLSLVSSHGSGVAASRLYAASTLSMLFHEAPLISPWQSSVPVSASRLRRVVALRNWPPLNRWRAS